MAGFVDIALADKREVLTLTLTVGIMTIYAYPAPQSHCLWPTVSGACKFCERGWHGEYCNMACIGYCDIGGCDKDTGRCLQCDHGYYSDNCTETCPSNCGISYDGNVYCHRHTGNCLEGCRLNWWGDKCTEECSENCTEKSCMSYDGSCSNGCIHGKTGPKCNKICSRGCVSGLCYQWNQNCVNGCKAGYQGEKCMMQCPVGCKDGLCDRSDGIEVCTQGCISGKTASSCDVSCPKFCHSCEQMTGECLSCEVGLWGQSCNTPCSSKCLNHTCDMKGNCQGCLTGSHGQRCDQPCPDGCPNCSRTDGTCGEVTETGKEDITVFKVFTGVTEPEHTTAVIGIVVGGVVLFIVIMLVLVKRGIIRRCRSSEKDPQPQSTCGLDKEVESSDALLAQKDTLQYCREG